MFVSTRLKTQGAAVTALSLLALGACDAPAQTTDLRPEGDPEVLSVLVFNDAVDGILETATFCKQNDAKRPGTVGILIYGAAIPICDLDLANGAGFRDDKGTTTTSDDTFTPGIVEDAVPSGWYVRIMFDELLDGDTAETLEPVLDPDTMEETGIFTGSLAETQPVTLTCDGADVPYDGYYSPSGNTVTWPLGPSLVIQPLDTSAVATGAECMISLKDVAKDKEGHAVPAAQRGPYTFNVAGLAATAVDPEPADPGDETTIDPASPFLISFNHFIDPASLTSPEDFSIEKVTDCSAASGTAVVAVVEGAEDDPFTIAISAATTVPAGLAWSESSFYRITFTDDAEVADVSGGTGGSDIAGLSVCFATDAAS
ncbi:MAG TPA: hypothetical protein VIU61_05385 [Kofleriaceae bacterium]